MKDLWEFVYKYQWGIAFSLSWSAHLVLTFCGLRRVNFFLVLGMMNFNLKIVLRIFMISLHAPSINFGFAFGDNLRSAAGGSGIQTPSGFSSPSEPQLSLRSPHFVWIKVCVMMCKTWNYWNGILGGCFAAVQSSISYTTEETAYFQKKPKCCGGILHSKADCLHQTEIHQEKWGHHV